MAQDPERLQVLVDKLQDLILETPQKTAAESVESRYRDGFHLKVRRAYLEHPGHPLESVILQKFGRLGKKSDLVEKSIRLLRENPGWMPVEIVEVFEALLIQEP